MDGSPQVDQEGASNCLDEEGREGRPPLLPVDYKDNYHDCDSVETWKPVMIFGTGATYSSINM